MPETLWNTKGFNYECIPYCETKKSTKNCEIAFLCVKLFEIQSLWNTKKFSTKIFSLWDEDNSTKNRDIPLSRAKIFIMFESSQTLNGSATKILGTLRQKTSEKNILTYPSYG